MPDIVPVSELRFVWWNVYDFAHYDPHKTAQARWPSRKEDYQEKCDRVDRVLTKIQSTHGQLQLVGLTEITLQAAIDLRNRLFPGWRMLSLDKGGGDSTLTIAVLWDSRLNLSEEPPIAPSRMPRGSRPMIVLDMKYASEWIRFIFCHWVSFDDKHNRVTQADALSVHVYQFLNNRNGAYRKHLVLMGDFNEEPHGLIEERLFAHKHRARAADSHYTDADIQRIHLYNCAWRFVGEKRPHGVLRVNEFVDGAGTLYWRKEKSWHTFDQLMVNSNLLTENVPFLDEKSVEAVYLAEAMDKDGLPRKFEITTKGPLGVSDHVPLLGCLVLSKGEHNVPL